MIEIWVLIMLMSDNGHTYVVSAEFISLEACQAALRSITEQDAREISGSVGGSDD